MPAYHRLSLTVPANAIDANGHVNNVEYLRWMQEAAISHADTSGCTATTQQLGASWVVRSHHVEYLRPAYADEPIVILTWIATMQKASSLRKYLIVRATDQVTLARGETNWVFVDVAKRRPKSIPPEVAQKFTLVGPEEEPTMLKEALSQK